MPEKKFISVLLICSLLAAYLPVTVIQAAENKTTIAVYKLNADGVDESMVSTLSNIMRSAIFQTGKYKMLTKEDMQRILDNLAEKQKIEPGCDTDACLAEIAGALGAEEMVTGSVGKVGKTYVINLRLVDTYLAETINTISTECVCEEDLLIQRIKETVLTLLKEKPQAGPQETSISRKKSKTWLWWTLGIVLVVGGGAVAASQPQPASSSDSSSSGDGNGSSGGKIQFSW